MPTLIEIQTDQFSITKSLINLLVAGLDDSVDIPTAIPRAREEFTGTGTTNEQIKDALKADDKFLEDIAYYLPALLPLAFPALSELDSAELFEIIDGCGNHGQHFIDIITYTRNIHLLSNISIQIGEFTPKQLMKLECHEWEGDTSFIQRLLDAATNLDQDTAQHQNAQKAGSEVFKAIFSDSKEKEDIYEILKSTYPKLDFKQIKTLARKLASPSEDKEQLKKLQECCEEFFMLDIARALSQTSKKFQLSEKLGTMSFFSQCTSFLTKEEKEGQAEQAQPKRRK